MVSWKLKEDLEGGKVEDNNDPTKKDMAVKNEFPAHIRDLYALQMLKSMFSFNQLYIRLANTLTHQRIFKTKTHSNFGTWICHWKFQMILVFGSFQERSEPTATL